MGRRCFAGLFVLLCLAVFAQAEETERRLNAQYEGKILLLRNPGDKAVRLGVPEEVRSPLAGHAGILIRVESLKLKKTEVEIQGRYVFRWQNKASEVCPVEWLSQKYRLRWQGGRQSEVELERGVGAVLTELKTVPEWVAPLPPRWPEGISRGWKATRSGPSEEIAPGLFTLGDDVTPPKCDICRPPSYSEYLAVAGKGQVVAAIIIGGSGRLEAMRIVRLDDYAGGMQAIAVFSGWRFKPALRAGKPIRTFEVATMWW